MLLRRGRAVAACAAALLAVAAVLGDGSSGFLTVPPVLAAAPACHCFRNREFEPSRPAATDDYLLATASNSLLSAVFGIPKAAIVQARMSGTPAEDLWVSAHVAHRLGLKREQLMTARGASASWAAALQSGTAPRERLGPRFAAALAAGAADADLARAALAETLDERVGTPQRELEALAARGATLQETVLASLLGLWTGRSAPEIRAAVTAGTGSWSGLLVGTGRLPGQMEIEIPKALRPEPRGSEK